MSAVQSFCPNPTHRTQHESDIAQAKQMDSLTRVPKLHSTYRVLKVDVSPRFDQCLGYELKALSGRRHEERLAVLRNNTRRRVSKHTADYPVQRCSSKFRRDVREMQKLKTSVHVQADPMGSRNCLLPLLSRSSRLLRPWLEV
jgi:hypothetical protein